MYKEEVSYEISEEPTKTYRHNIKKYERYPKRKISYAISTEEENSKVKKLNWYKKWN